MTQAQDATKARLLEAAGEEFAEKGFVGATIRAIVERAGAKNIAAVNYYFGDKERLYEQAVIEAHRCGVGGEFPEGMGDLPPSEQLRGFVRNFLEGVLAVGHQDSWHHALMLREIARPSHASETLVREVIRPKFQKLFAILREACPEADEKRLTASAFSVIGQCLHYKIGRPIAERLIGAEAFAALDLDYLADHITNFSLAGLGLAPPACAEARPTRTARANQGGR